MIVSCMEKNFLTVFSARFYKNAWVYAVISSVGDLQPYIQVMDQLHTLVKLLTSFTRWVGDWSRPKGGLDMVGKAKIFTSTGYSPGIQARVVPIQTELFGLQLHACLGS